MKISFRIASAFIGICLSFGAVHARDNGLFSPVNRFGLSYGYSDSLRAAVIQARTRFLSRPSDWRFARQAGNLVFDDTGLRAAASFDMTLGGTAVDNDGISFGAIDGLLTLASAHLDARVDLGVFTADRLVSGFPLEDDDERFMAGSERPIAGAIDFRFGVREAYLTAKIKNLDVSVGKMKLRWGPGYKGTLGLSGTTYAPFYFYNVNFGLGDVFKMSSFLAGYDDEDRFAGDVAAADSLIVKANGRVLSTMPARYGAGQRVDVRLGKHFQFGLYELADFFGAGDLTRFANPLQFYYTVNSSSGTNNANLLAGFDCNAVFAPWRFYGEILNDDVTMFEHVGNPDKYAFQLGAQYFPKGYIVHTGVEYTHVTRYTYGHYTALNRHTLWGESLGWPWGNCQESFAGHAVFRLSERMRSTIEACLWLKGRGDLTDDWYADGSPDLDHAPFWPRPRSEMVSLTLNADYCLKNWLSIDCTYRPVFGGGKPSHALYGYLTLTPPWERKIGK